MQLSKDSVSRASPIARLYEQHAPALFAFLRQRTQSREDAEDVLVEIFVAAIEYHELLQLSEKEQAAWLWRVARNKVVDAYRYSKPRQAIDLNLVTDLLYDDDERAPEVLALRQEEYAHLHAHLEQLPPLQREAMRLRYANDLRYAEIATILGKREGAIRVMLSRTLHLLRSIYQKDQKGDHS